MFSQQLKAFEKFLFGYKRIYTLRHIQTSRSSLSSKLFSIMTITFEMSGGFASLPALSSPVTIDTAQIEPQTRTELESLVRLSRFFDQPSRSTPAKGAADYRTYTITVQDGARVYTIQLTDPITDINLEQLVSRLRVMARKTTP
jgi:Emfourin